MNYIVMDLEWNTVYAQRLQGYFSELIEFGAVLLDDDLREAGSFSRLVCGQVGGDKLRSHVRRLTGLTSEDIRGGEPFASVYADFRAFVLSRPGERVFVTWGDGDIRVLLQNCRYFDDDNEPDYFDYYVDLQDDYQKRNRLSPALQTGLAAAAASLGIDPEAYEQHRSLGDSRLTADILRATFDKSAFAARMRVCDEHFFAALQFKPRPITDLRHPAVDEKELYYRCPVCAVLCERKTDWRFGNRGFFADFTCPRCGLRARATVGFIRHYDHIKIKRSSRFVHK
jgi:inhibitor of KinA sporulation pathway (predicted exonuclease)